YRSRFLSVSPQASFNVKPAFSSYLRQYAQVTFDTSPQRGNHPRHKKYRGQQRRCGRNTTML
ncbi:MAG: hypothetical protein ACLFS5_03350, partial [Spirochaetaceae bacterium]